ncbi:tyrosine-type recombinase/integrase [Streptomyces afghaniensis]|uniref:tyrosine-type recombinase/integrase n=1 Tax=Streptomyces afghaniensis TaxID=66865 RepID=UPI002789CB9F|nr:site-specific integrase [Streptomyces afghaniensis]MDQ1018789.1 integrase [Streptomyces afghaniensis]
MAYVKAMKNGKGVVTSHRVIWRLGGSRTGAPQAERFDATEEGKEAAEIFCEAVNEAGQQWPLGWVKGQGYIAPDAEVPAEDRYRFRTYALAMFDNKTGIQEQYRKDCIRDLERYVFPTFENCDVRSVEHFNHDTVQAWVRKLEKTKVHKGRAPKNGTPKLHPMSPKTIRNLHGLLSAVLQKAVNSEPPLRARNPCELTSLPRTDDDGGDGGEDIEFLTPDEMDGLISCMERRSDQLLAIVKYGTGMRWGEISALAPECLVDWRTDKPKIRVKRAWKKDGNGGYYIGVPKSRRGRRSLRVSSAVVDAIEELGGEDNDNPSRLFFTGDQDGNRLHYSTFYDRWQRAVHRAKAAGLLPSHKNPTPHDARHSHAAVLISEGRGLTYVQRRLGHESIKTTSDTYGHLLPEADDDAMEIIDRSLIRGREGGDGRMPAPRTPRGGPAVPAADAQPGSVVHVVVFPGGHQEAFWRADFARLVADVWRLERREEPRVETRSASLWEARHGGLDGVHPSMPARAKVWSLGPVVYGPDGEQQAAAPDAHELREQWQWGWEEGYTAEPACWYAQHRPGPGAQTEAAAWGTDEKQVRAVYVKARAKALRICGRHPEAATAGVGQPDS